MSIGTLFPELKNTVAADLDSSNDKLKGFKKYDSFQEVAFQIFASKKEHSKLTVKDVWKPVHVVENMHNEKEALFNTMVQENLKFMKCSKCKQDGVIVNIKQTRGGDEGSTVFYNCTLCGFSRKS